MLERWNCTEHLTEHTSNFTKVNEGLVELPPPKASFRIRISEETFLQISVFPTKKDPTAEVISVQIRRAPREAGDDWETVNKIALYRSPEGSYSQLPDREKPPSKPTPTQQAKVLDT